MAKVGEGDPRWIVSNRDDGKNVNNWHWTETDLSGWARNKLKSLVENQTIENDKVSIKTSDLTLEGEVTVNTRKQKTIIFYELNMSVKWTGTYLPTATTGKGNIKVPYISEENDDDDFEVQVHIDDESTKDLSNLKSEVRSKIIPYLKEQIPIMLKELRETSIQKTKLAPKQNNSSKLLDEIAPIVFKDPSSLPPPSPSITSTSSPSTSTPTSTSTSTTSSPSINANKPSTTPATSTSTSSSSSNINEKLNVKSTTIAKTSNFTLTEKFVCTPRDIYESLLIPARVKAYSGGDSEISPEQGAKFKLFGASVTGENIELIPNKKIVQKWRMSSWKEDLYSTVTIELEDKNGKTVLKLEHTGVPEDDLERTRIGWNENFFRRIKGIFGFGAIV